MLEKDQLVDLIYRLEKERVVWKAERVDKGKGKEVEIYPDDLEYRISELKRRKKASPDASLPPASEQQVVGPLQQAESEPVPAEMSVVTQIPELLLSPTSAEPQQTQQEQASLSLPMPSLPHPQPHPMFPTHPGLPTHPPPLPFIYPPVYVAPQPSTSPPISVPSNETQSVSIPGGKTNSGRAANGVGGNGMPSYEEMLVMAIADLREPEGSAPKNLFDWMLARFPLASNFRPSAHQALQKAYKRGRLERLGAKYRLNPNWEGGSTSRRTTRRPQMGNAGIGIPGRLPGFPWAMIPAPPPVDSHQGTPSQVMPHAFSQPHQAPSMTIPPQTSGNGEINSLEFLNTASTGDNTSPGAAALLQAIAGINGMMDEADDGKTESGDEEDEEGAEDDTHAALQASLDSLAEQLRAAAAASVTM
ncbi:hypothetical protein FRC03_003083 [Tulasnella sp. 419]|nr:hypothetical protein FRC03_003083 [Tulasnella sp. 419]